MGDHGNRLSGTGSVVAHTEIFKGMSAAPDELVKRLDMTKYFDWNVKH